MWQGGLCAICGTPVAPARRALDHDHDPASRLVRGWLCTHCNMLEGTGSSPCSATLQVSRNNPGQVPPGLP
ncbi:endonuclease domain-containing protein [Streptomyces sp. enrichment culture]|uniref:endonuclease domain-containing protein n=1 Tax=Streptomyces sp. enrichment culture TaxID=1795815 RepID=UPI003F573A89